MVAILSLLAILAGCSNTGSQSTLDEVKDSKVLRVGTEGTYSPFSYHDPGTNQLTGYDIEVITAVAGKLGARPEFVEAPFDALFASLVSNRFDVVANQVTKNAEREAKYALSAPYTVSDGVIITRTDDTSISGLSDLQGKTTAQSSTSNWAQVAKDAGAKVEAVEGFTQAVTLVKQGRVDATVNDNLAALQYFKTTSDNDVKIAAKTGDTSEQVFALRQDDGALRDAINDALTQLRDDGTLASISTKYFGTRRLHRRRRCRGAGPERPDPSTWELIKDSTGPMALATIKATIPLTIISFASVWSSRWSWR